ncbi:hypothetical protein SUGI_0805060 [Cryptomeria japonica]|uniref:E3 ubiquitin-protein ligase ATL6 n=1 Tax=Cryptomeria japonica TaxID=3369 RepID=UPI002414A082|nr:E3 ubiquitin-protein ligase ATL6 [Cryptomeria japonica]GLJ39416.1 hypothetical protein SUGI_0805060 [Cryptomeria japonica]
MESRRIALENLIADGVLFVRRLEENNTGNGFDGPYNFNTRFNPSMAIIIVVLLSAFFFMGFFSIYIRRCSGESGSGGSRRPGGLRLGGGGNNAEGLQREATRGLDKAIIESFPVFSFKLVKGLKAQAKGSECAVCLNDFEDDEMLRLLPKCSHAFHPECIDMWLCSHTTCPVCRVDLLPAEEGSDPSGTESGVVAPQGEPEPEVVIVVDNGNDESVPVARAIEAGESSATEEPSAMEKVRRSHSTGHSLVRVRKELEQPTEWYIATPRGLTPGLYRSCSFVAMHHSRSQGASSSSKVDAAACLKAGGASGRDAGSSMQEPRTRSERWGGISSMNPAAILRSFSERPASRLSRPPVVPQQDRRAYLKKTFNWLTGKDRDRGDGSVSVSSRRGDHSGSVGGNV